MASRHRFTHLRIAGAAGAPFSDPPTARNAGFAAGRNDGRLQGLSNAPADASGALATRSPDFGDSTPFWVQGFGEGYQNGYDQGRAEYLASMAPKSLSSGSSSSGSSSSGSSSGGDAGIVDSGLPLTPARYGVDAEAGSLASTVADGSSSSLSTMQKIGIVTGLGLGVVGVAVLVARSRKRSRRR